MHNSRANTVLFTLVPFDRYQKYSRLPTSGIRSSGKRGGIREIRAWNFGANEGNRVSTVRTEAYARWMGAEIKIYRISRLFGWFNEA